MSKKLTPERKFQAKVRSHLDDLSGQLVPVLKKLISYSYPEKVFTLSFEIFPDSFTSQFPVRVFFMDNENCEHFEYIDGVAQYPSPVDPELLDVDKVYPDEVEEAFEGYEELDLWTLAAAETALWFYDCWKKAGGKRFGLGATIADHDSPEELNLQNGKWQEKNALFTS